MSEQKIFDKISCCGKTVKINPRFILDCTTICDMISDIKERSMIPVLCGPAALTHLHAAWEQTCNGTMNLHEFVENNSPQRIAGVINTASYLGMHAMRGRLNHFLAKNYSKYAGKIRALFKKPVKRKISQKSIKTPRKRQKK